MKSSQLLRGALGIALFIGGLSVAAFGQVVAFSGGTYSQDFDGLPTVPSGGPYPAFNGTADGPYSLSNTSWSVTPFTTTGMAGWQIFDTLSGSTAAGLNANYGQGTVAAAQSYGADASTDRALGALAGATRVMAFGLVLQNTSGVAITEVDIAFTGEQWRLGRTGSADTLSFSYQVGANSDIATGAFTAHSALNFVTPTTAGTIGALNGNDLLNQVSLSNTLALTWNPGDYLVLRWTDFNETGNDHGLAIDNFSVTAAAIPEPSTYALLAGGLVLLLPMSRRFRQRTS